MRVAVGRLKSTFPRVQAVFSGHPEPVEYLVKLKALLTELLKALKEKRPKPIALKREVERLLKTPREKKVLHHFNPVLLEIVNVISPPTEEEASLLIELGSVNKRRRGLWLPWESFRGDLIQFGELHVVGGRGEEGGRGRRFVAAAAAAA